MELRVQYSGTEGQWHRRVLLLTAEQSSIIGVHFKPGGAFPFLRVPANELRNMHVSMDELWGAAGVDLRNRLLEANTPEAKFRTLEKTLLAQAAGSLTRHPALDFALREFRDMPKLRTISNVIERIGLSKRRFIQVFDERVGLTPKSFCRVRRFQRALRMIAKVAGSSGRTWPWIAAISTKRTLSMTSGIFPGSIHQPISTTELTTSTTSGWPSKVTFLQYRSFSLGSG